MSQVDRLQSLLHRVQENRAKPREAASAVAAVEQIAMATPVAAPMAAPVRMPAVASMAVAPPQPSSAPPAPLPVPKRVASGPPAPFVSPIAAAAPPVSGRPRTATPLEQAFEGEIVGRRAKAAPAVPLPHGRLSSRPPAAAPTRPEVIDIPLPPAPQRPIAQVTSPAPGMSEPTFGELLRRSLALRTR